MSKRSRYGTYRCKTCGDRVTNNAVGRAAHERGSKCVPRGVIDLGPRLRLVPKKENGG